MSLFNKFVPFKRDVESYLKKCKQVFDETQNKSASRRIENFLKDFESQRYNLTITGSFNRGKSTLLNSLMERSDDHISPIGFEACTSAIIRYFDKGLNKDKREKALVYFNEPEKSTEEVKLSRLEEYVTEKGNPKNRKGIRSVEVFGDFPEWSQAVTIVDTPGQNTVYGHHDTLLMDFLPYADAIIFLVAADIPLDGGDIALINELSTKQNKKIFFVLTKIDEIDNDELPEVKDYVIQTIQEKGINCESLYSVAAKPVFDALKNNASENEIQNLKEEHGILELEHDLEDFIVANSDQTAILKIRIKAILEECRESCNQFREYAEGIIKRDSFDITKLNGEKQDLVDHNEELRKSSKQALKKFERDWARELNRFSRKFSAKSSAIDDRIMETLHKGGFLGALFTSFKLTKQIEKVVKQELSLIALNLEENLQKIVEQLNKEIDEDVIVYLKNRSHSDLFTPLGSATAGLALGATASWSFTTASAAASGAQASFAAWAASLTPKAVEGVGLAKKVVNLNTYTQGGIWGWTKGLFIGKAFTTATATTTTPGGAVVAGNATWAGAAPMIGSIVAAAVSIGISIAVTYIVQKLLHFGLKEFQGARIPAISEKIIAEMENEVFKSLDIVKTEIIQSYTEMIEDIINGNLERIEEIEEIMEKNDPEERAKLEDRLNRIKGLLPQADELIGDQALIMS